MDTESFLLRRQQIQAEMEAGRASIVDQASYRGPTLFSIPLLSWARLFMGPSPEGWLLRAVQKVAWVAIVPAIVGLFKQRPSLPSWGEGISGLLSRLNFWPFRSARK